MVIIVLEYVKIIQKDPYKLGFVDEYSPKEWESIINYKLSEYNERAYVDSTMNINNILIILELNLECNDLESLKYIKIEKKRFQDYYKRILDDIGSSEFYDLYLK